MTNWVIDLDGVMWRGAEPIEGSSDAVATLLARGDRVVFCTNNSTQTGVQRAQQLAERGVPEGADVLTSADALLGLVEPAERILVLGSPGLAEVLCGHGSKAVTTEAVLSGGGDDPATRYESVVVGLTRTFDYQQLDLALRAVLDGARLLASNADATFPGAGGLHPGAGSILAALETATGRKATVAGKPHPPMVEVIRAHLSGDADHTVVVGDRLDTDGRLAQGLGARFALVLSGVNARADLDIDVHVLDSGPDEGDFALIEGVPVALVAADLATVVETLTW